MHVPIGDHRSEMRGSWLLPAMVVACAIVIVAILGVVADPQWWFIGVAMAVELGVVFVGVRLVLPVLSDGEVADAHEAADSHGTFAALAGSLVGMHDHGSEQLAGHSSGHRPHVAARLRVGGPEYSRTHLEEPALGSVVGE